MCTIEGAVPLGWVSFHSCERATALKKAPKRQAFLREVQVSQGCFTQTHPKGRSSPVESLLRLWGLSCTLPSFTISTQRSFLEPGMYSLSCGA